MNKFIYLILFFGLIFISCDNELNNLSDNNDPSREGIKLYAQKHIDLKTKGVALKDNLWENGQTIKIKFLNGTTLQQDLVKKLSVEWLDYANLSFEFVEAGEQAEIKIAFNWQGDGVTWSQVGPDAKYVPQNQPSLNFGNLRSTEKLAKRDILMQFGHVLGLVNEHQSEGSPIEFDTEVLFDYYAAEGWTVKEVTDFFLIPFSDTKTIREEYDSKSIMCWPIDEILTLNGFGQARNSELSEGDKEFIAKLYPKISNELELAIEIVSHGTGSRSNFDLYGVDSVFVDWGWNDLKMGYKNDGYVVFAGFPLDQYPSYGSDYITKLYFDPLDLYQLHIGYFNISSIDLSKCTNLKDLTLSSHKSLYNLDISKNTKLNYLGLFGTFMSEVDLSKNVDLDHITIYRCENLIKLNVSNNKKLKDIQLKSSAFITNRESFVAFAESLPDNIDQINRELRVDNLDSAIWIKDICNAKGWTVIVSGIGEI